MMVNRERDIPESHRASLILIYVGNDAALRGTGIPAPPVSEIYAQRYCTY